MSGKRRKYTPEFREQAARLVIETGRPVAHVAAEIGATHGRTNLNYVRLRREAANQKGLYTLERIKRSQSPESAENPQVRP